MNSILNEILPLFSQLAEKKPLVHNITNYVTVNDCANVILGIGGSPVMADDILECEEITSISSALVINIGTLNSRTIESMIASGKKANQLEIPVVLDPVGAGASTLRNNTAKRLLEEVHFSVIRGNISEISFLAGLSANTKGVDASEIDTSLDALSLARTMAKKYHTTIAITGPIDTISDGTKTFTLENGVSLLSKVTGTGCMTTSLIGAFLGASKNGLYSAICGVLTMSLAGELSFEKYGALGTGSFHLGIVDAISVLNKEIITERAKIHEK